LKFGVECRNRFSTPHVFTETDLDFYLHRGRCSLNLSKHSSAADVDPKVVLPTQALLIPDST
jgi:hypothetical protein